MIDERGRPTQGARVSGRALAPRSGASLGALVLLGAVIAGCKVNSDDLHRWERTEHGPEKLVAVLSHDKYDQNLRIEAGWSLIEMPKRQGQAVGVSGAKDGKDLLDQLIAMPATDRDQIMAGLWKRLQPKVGEPLQPGPDGKGWVDSSVVYKDATFTLYEAAVSSPPRLVLKDPNIVNEMTVALADWAIGKDSDKIEARLQAFETRLENTGQQYGVAKVIGTVGMEAIRRLPALLSAPAAIRSQHLDAIVTSVTDTQPKSSKPGEVELYKKTRDDMSAQYAKLLDASVHNGYIDSIRTESESALKSSSNPAAKKALDAKPPPGVDCDKVLAAAVATGVDPADAHFADALKKTTTDLKLDGQDKHYAYCKFFGDTRDERLSQVVFGLAKKLGGKPISDELMTIATNENAQKEHRQWALIALQGNFDKTNGDALNKFLAIAKSNAADEVKHAALAAGVADYPEDQQIKGLYTLFDVPYWKVRLDAAQQIIQLMAKLKDKAPTTVKEFLSKLPSKVEDKIAIGEGRTYAFLLAPLPKEMKVTELMADTLDDRSLGARLTAFAWFEVQGTPADEPLVSKYAESKDPVPKCKDEDDCGWSRGCDVPKAGGKPGEVETKSVATIGDYVTYCVKPQIENRAKEAAAAKDAPKDAPK